VPLGTDKNYSTVHLKVFDLDPIYGTNSAHKAACMQGYRAKLSRLDLNSATEKCQVLEARRANVAQKPEREQSLTMPNVSTCKPGGMYRRTIGWVYWTVSE
jgi:hypothetical protein